MGLLHIYCGYGKGKTTAAMGLALRVAGAGMRVHSTPRCCEIVLTGREPEQKFIDAADYVSEIKAVKHPYLNGIDARKGIEY